MLFHFLEVQHDRLHLLCSWNKFNTFSAEIHSKTSLIKVDANETAREKSVKHQRFIT